MEENKTQPRHKVDIREMNVDDEATLRMICDRCEDALAGCGERISDQEVHAIVRKKVLPPKGVSEKYHAKLIFFDGEPAGFMTYYEGYPFDRTVWIGSFYLVPEVRGQSLGSQIMMMFKQNLIELGYMQFAAQLHRMNLRGQDFFRKHQFVLDQRSIDRDFLLYFCTYRSKTEKTK